MRPSSFLPSGESVSPTSSSPHRLVVFLTALGRCATIPQAMRVAAALAAEELDTEVGALIEGGAVKAAVGFGQDAIPVDTLVTVRLGTGRCDVPGLGPCHTLAAAWNSERSGKLMVARSDRPFDSHERDLLLGMAGAFAMAADSIRALEQGRAQLRTLEVLLGIQRAITHREPLTAILTAVTDGASLVLGGCPVDLLLDDALDPEHPVHAGAPILPGSQTFQAPVHVQGVPAGHLRATSMNGAPLDADDCALLSAFAEHASMALTDARMVEAMEEAFHDPLTGLPNRPLFLETLTTALLEHPDGTLAVLFVDLDRFKAVNDTLGHAAGDELLLDVADRLRAVAAPSASVARFGGDEFALLVTHEGELAVAADVAAGVISSLAEPFVVRGKTVVVGATVGIAHNGGGRSASELLADADLAMYRGKAAGGGRSAFFDPQMRRELAARIDLEADLAGALNRGELAVFFQPIVNLVTGRLVAVEALIRWRHPVRGDVPPSELIPIAESNGFIVPIGKWVLGRACEWAATWRTTLPSLRVSVNVSVHQLRDPSFVADVEHLLAAASLPPEALILEVTESALIADDDETVSSLMALDALGIAIALDDFGTGYSSLSYLQRLPVHVLKIDRSFVSGAVGVKSDKLVRSIVDLGQAYGLEVIAEGIEDQSQLVGLVDKGCVLGQGYFLGRPAEPESLQAPSRTQPDAATSARPIDTASR